MATELDRIINQFDSLIPFIALSRQDIFDLLNRERAVWFSNNIKALPSVYDLYRKQINHATLILGYSYFEVFLNDLLAEILRHRPAILPKNKQMTYSEVIGKATIASLINEMIKKELTDLLYKSMADIINKLRQKYNFTISQDEEDMLCKYSIIRNCIIHNSSRADHRLAEYDGFDLGSEFEISSSEIHETGLMLRSLVRKMYNEAKENHFQNV